MFNRKPIHESKVRGDSQSEERERGAQDEGETPPWSEFGGFFEKGEIERFVETEEIEGYKKRVKEWLSLNYPVHILGPTGCGKTSLALSIADDLDRPTIWINGDEALTTEDLVGSYSQVKKESISDQYIHNVLKKKDVIKKEWVDNPLSVACKEGYTLVYNEFSRTFPEANNVLLSVFEEGILERPTREGEERFLEVHPSFNAILTSNSVEYAGVHDPQDALIDRVVSIHMDWYDRESEIQIVEAHTPINNGTAEKVVDTVRTLREKVDKEEAPGTRACVMLGKACSEIDRVPREQLVLDVISSKIKSVEEVEEKMGLVKEAMEETGWD